MRIAALAFGILAGLVASFILALGGLDAAELGHLDGRQMQLVDFGLFVVANLGVLGAGLVLAAPLAGLVLFVLGAVGWVAAAVVLRHGPDYVMLTPPAILTVAIVLAAVALFRRRSHDRDVLDDDERKYLEFHLNVVGCRYCRANLEDLRARRSEPSTGGAVPDAVRRERMFKSSVGALRKR